VGFDERSHHIGAAGQAAVAFLQHFEGLTDTRRRAEVDPKLAASHLVRTSLRHRMLPVEGEVQLSHIHPRPTDEAEIPSCGLLLASAAT
jgi:hypothetical protein